MLAADSAAMLIKSARHALEQIVREVERLVERCDEDSLVLSVRTNIIDRNEQAAEPVNRHTGVS